MLVIGKGVFVLNRMDIYESSPIFIQNILTTLEGKRRAKIRFGSEYQKNLEFFKNFDYSDRESIKKIQNERFLKLLNHAVTFSPFYKEFYKDVDISKVKSANDIKMLPILEKETVRKHLEEMYTIPKKGCHLSKTGGTTGTSLRFRNKIDDFQTRLAYLDAFKARHGFIHRDMKRASFNRSNIVPPNQKKKIFWRDNKAMNQRIYSTHRCKGENIKYYVENLNSFKPHSIDGYPSSIYDIARFINSNNIKLDFVPIAILTTSETLYPSYRAEIEKAFKCRIYDQYSSSEGATFIWECECGSLHIGEDTGIIEIDEDGEMLITSFFTYGTPLIRYKIGDKASPSPENFICPCGCAMKTVSRLEGRTMDFLLSKSHGKFTSIHLGSSVELLSTSVRAAQFVQNEIGTVHIYLEVDENYDKDQDIILQKELFFKMGHDMNFIFHHTTNIPKEKSGKFKFIVNNLK